MSVTLYQDYQKKIVPALQKELGLKNVMQVPKIKKVVLNVGVGKMLKEANFIDTVEKNLKAITGQQPVRTKARISISNFKLREGQEIGLKVTLRGPRMYHFLEKLVKVTFPRLRDFHGISDNGFDRQGNFSIGLKENSAFPEVKATEIEKMHGLEIIVQIKSKGKEESKALLTHLGFPFIKK